MFRSVTKMCCICNRIANFVANITGQYMIVTTFKTCMDRLGGKLDAEELPSLQDACLEKLENVR